MRVPDVPKKPVAALLTLGDYVDAGIEVWSYCSSGLGHKHSVDLKALVARHGRGRQIDYALKLTLTSPVCGANGGGLKIHKPHLDP